MNPVSTAPLQFTPTSHATKYDQPGTVAHLDTHPGGVLGKVMHWPTSRQFVSTETPEAQAFASFDAAFDGALALSRSTREEPTAHWAKYGQQAHQQSTAVLQVADGAFRIAKVDWSSNQELESSYDMGKVTSDKTVQELVALIGRDKWLDFRTSETAEPQDI